MTEHAATDVVPQTGEFVCTSCGDATEFEAGDDFSVCGACGDENAGWTPVGEEGEKGKGGLAGEEAEEDVAE